VEYGSLLSILAECKLTVNWLLLNRSGWCQLLRALISSIGTPNWWAKDSSPLQAHITSGVETLYHKMGLQGGNKQPICKEIRNAMTIHQGEGLHTLCRYLRHKTKGNGDGSCQA